MFSEAFVCSRGGADRHPRGRPQSLWRETPWMENPYLLDGTPPHPVMTASGNHCSGWYGSYWNAFLLKDIFIWKCFLALVESTWWLLLAFFPQNFGMLWEMELRHFMNTSCVMVTLKPFML